MRVEVGNEGVENGYRLEEVKAWDSGWGNEGPCKLLDSVGSRQIWVFRADKYFTFLFCALCFLSCLSFVFSLFGLVLPLFFISLLIKQLPQP